MWLIRAKTLELVKFREADLPKYAIASHQWAAGSEVSRQDVQNFQNMDREGWQKLRNLANFLKTNAPLIQWLWMDTCCMDELGSRAELSEAINSSFRRFREAALCIAHLADVGAGEDCSFSESEWFTRAWTLQEPIAPPVIIFVSGEWEVIGNKGKAAESYAPEIVGRDLCPEIAAITGIPQKVLHDFNASLNFSVEQRLAWMDKRASTRPEDKYYALYGIFDVHLGANYGEGQTGAKRRLLAGIKEVEEERNRNFVYDQLDDAGATIRLMTIPETEEYDEPISCYLSHHSLNSKPKYVALSYHWGNPKYTSVIRIMPNDVPGRESLLSITNNVDVALRELRRRGVSTVWADMACINQGDVFERNQQIKLMGRIYAEAEKVIAWTGAACNGSSDAISAMVKDAHSSENTTVIEHHPLTSRDGHIRTFLSRPYFTRAWIIQELAKAQLAELWSGEDTLQLKDLFAFISDQKRAALRPIQEILFEAIRLFHKDEQWSKKGVCRMSLCQALTASRSSIASDPRDNIYAILGLTFDGDDVVGQPDYSSSVEDVFAEASRTMIGTQGHTSLMLLARGSHDTGSRASWMPDWSERTPLPPWIRACLDRGRETLDFHSSAEEDILTVAGYCVDDVWEDCTQGFRDDDGPIRAKKTPEHHLCVQDWMARFFNDPMHRSAALRRSRQAMCPSGTESVVDEQRSTEEARILAFESGIEQAARYAMRLVRLARRGFQMVHRDAEHHDQIWRLENCALPVVLRPLSNDRFVFIGEVFADVQEKAQRYFDWELDLDLDEMSAVNHFPTGLVTKISIV